MNNDELKVERLVLWFATSVMVGCAVGFVLVTLWRAL